MEWLQVVRRVTIWTLGIREDKSSAVEEIWLLVVATSTQARGSLASQHRNRLRIMLISHRHVV